jgi:exodeoxyribonuclease VII large subunit
VNATPASPPAARTRRARDTETAVRAGRAAAPAPADAIPGEHASVPLTVSIVTEAAREILEATFLPVWVRGEVTDLKLHRNGHWYFTLRDHASQLRCVVWSRDQRGIPAPPDDGMQVVARGRVTVYPARGDLQFVVSAIEAEGDGLWRKALERTRARLEADGLLAASRKRPLPRFPRRIAVITSIDGAALRDILAVAHRRSPLVDIVVVPAAVQGDGAAAELRAAVMTVSRWGACDVVIIGRGGGGREDLWAFNDERLARAIAACPVPTISAVGHEIDITMCDLVADVRAPTPSAAAETAVPMLSDLTSALSDCRAQLGGSLRRRIEMAHVRCGRIRAELTGRAGRVGERRRSRVQALAGELGVLSPLGTLARGYAVARDTGGHTLSSVTEFSPGDAFDLLVRDGTVRAGVDSVRPDGRTGAPPR